MQVTQSLITMKILTNIISPLFTPRQKALQRFAQDSDSIQQNELFAILKNAQQTIWGLQYDIKTIKTYTDFVQRIPIQTYDMLKPFIEQMMNGEKDILCQGKISWFAKSSGTTHDKSKYIPVNSDILKQCHYQGAFDTISFYLRNRPDSRFFSHKGLILGGSHSTSPVNRNAHCGDLSAVLLQNMNPLANLIRVPSKEIILMNEWESKIKAIVDNTFQSDVGNLSGVPSWMLVLIKEVLKKSGRDNLSEVWPNLEVFFHGGINFEPYREQYQTLIPSDRMQYMETYNASEGFFGIQDDPDDPALMLMLDYGIFYEFIPMNELEKESPRVIPLSEVEINQNYAMLITTRGGLWRYLIGDTIRFVSKFPHKFIITGRTKNYINAFGEELMVDNADQAIAYVAKMTRSKVKDYSAGPRFILDKAKGYHEWVIEFEKTPDSLDYFAEMLDYKLQDLNSDYEAKRYKNISLQPLLIKPVKEGTFHVWLKQKGKLGGQHKIPRLTNDSTLINELLAI